MFDISIHAAQEGCDSNARQKRFVSNISIHAAQEGCDHISTSTICYNFKFQSTQPKRAATAMLGRNVLSAIFQSTQPKRAATEYDSGNYKNISISIHAAQEGCD